ITADFDGDGVIDRFGVDGYSRVHALLQVGGDVYDDEFAPTQVVFDSDATAQAFQFGLDLINHRVVHANNNERRRWTEGLSGMSFTGCYQVPGYRESLQFQWDVGPVPKGPAGAWTDHGGSAIQMLAS